MTVLVGSKIHFDSMKIKDTVQKEIGADVVIEGEVFEVQNREMWDKSYRHKVGIYDGDSSIFVTFKNETEVKEIQKGVYLKVKGKTDKSKWTRWEVEVVANAIEQNELPEGWIKEVSDDAEEKRIELNAYSTMSQMEGIIPIANLIKQAKKMGHKKIALTDTGAQAYPDAYNVALKEGVDVIFGLSVQMVDEKEYPVIHNPIDLSFKNAIYSVFDVETTGLSVMNDHIIEIGCSKFKDGEKIDSMQCFVKSPKPISEFISDMTKITQSMVDQEGIELKEAMSQFKEFTKGTVLVAHNATFDIGMIEMGYRRAEMDIPKLPVIDTLQLSRCINKEMKKHSLDKLASLYQVKQSSHHRADDDAMVTGYILMKMLEQTETLNVNNLQQLNDLMDENFFSYLFPKRITLLAKNKKGMKNIYKIISKSHVDEITGRGPVIRKSSLNELREDILIGSGSHLSPIFEKALNKYPQEVFEEAKFYDYIEIQPATVAEHMVKENQTDSFENIEKAWKTIYKIGKKLNKPIVATGHVHYLNEEDRIFYNIVLYNEKAGRAHGTRRGRLDELQGPAHFRTTNEMLGEFPYLSKEETKEVVITNTHKLADMCIMESPVQLDENGHQKLFTPKIEGSDEQLSDMCYKRAKEIYGEDLPEIVEKRLKRELGSIIKHGFSVIYLISQKLVKKSNERGYLVGSRGSVGSSFVATMSGITDVNPLAPHYICPSCKKIEFITDGSVGSGFDLPAKTCECGHEFHRDGQDIPFETFLGFEGDKVPDIDLNFSGEDQSNAHKDVELEFGTEYVLRAGTVGTIAEKTAFGYVKDYMEGHELKWSNAEVNRKAIQITGVKRTTGQHPGGMLVIPDYMDVHDFTGAQYPANKKLDKDKNVQQRTSHFDFHSIHDNVLKLDILGHDAPTIIRLLQDFTGIGPKQVPPCDPKVMKLFYEPEEALGIKLSQIKADTGTLGIPELGTDFVQKMILETKPKTFEELVRISGLSHGTDVWNGNAQELIQKGGLTLKDVIDTRDNIMVYLMHKGMEPKLSFTIMESVRKGKGLKDEWIPVMKQHGIENWYIESCKKIKYMFPKAHAVAYVEQATKIAWFKIYHPLEYYAAVFSARYFDQDITELMQPSANVRNRIEELKNEISQKKSSGQSVQKDAQLLNALNLALEAKARGIKFGTLRLYESNNNRYKIDSEKNELIPPFSAIKGVGQKVADRIYDEAQIQVFRGLDDFKARTGANKTNLKFLRDLGCLKEVEAKQHRFF